jgi:hypothetical protein
MVFLWGAMKFTSDPVALATGAEGAEFGDFKTVRRLFGISRAHLYRLGAEGKIKSSVLRQRGALRGRRLWYLPSVRQLLVANMEGGAPW